MKNLKKLFVVFIAMVTAIGWIYEGPLMVKRIIKSDLKLEN